MKKSTDATIQKCKDHLAAEKKEAAEKFNQFIRNLELEFKNDPNGIAHIYCLIQ